MFRTKIQSLMLVDGYHYRFHPAGPYLNDGDSMQSSFEDKISFNLSSFLTESSVQASMGNSSMQSNL